MSLITRMRKQKAVLWPFKSHNGYGELTFEDPVEIDCRWDDSAVVYFTPSGEQATSNGVIYVDRIISERSRVREGAMETIEDLDPTRNKGVFEIKRTTKTPNLKNTETLITCYLG